VPAREGIVLSPRATRLAGKQDRRSTRVAYWHYALIDEMAKGFGVLVGQPFRERVTPVHRRTDAIVSSAATRAESSPGRSMLMLRRSQYGDTFCAGGVCQSTVERGKRELFQKC
jgi:hypothetical protein